MALGAMKTLSNRFVNLGSKFWVGVGSGSGAASVHHLNRLMGDKGLDTAILIDARGPSELSGSSTKCLNFYSTQESSSAHWPELESVRKSWGQAVEGCENFPVQVRMHSGLSGQAFSIAEDLKERLRPGGIWEGLALDYTRAPGEQVLASDRFSTPQVFSLLPELQEAHLKLKPDCRDYLTLREQLQPQALARINN
jgi:hypothetical protein